MNNMGKKIPPKITIALNAKNEWVFIDDVPQNGNQCDCFCPYCHAPLQAKKRGTRDNTTLRTCQIVNAMYRTSLLFICWQKK